MEKGKLTGPERRLLLKIARQAIETAKQRFICRILHVISSRLYRAYT
ncbi:MAG: hypothetical protein U9Q89_04455 [Thermodesulfobacteriota bacterium]|nr:hypothetical protein [Thermodesulfobacteriota bacterium]